MAYTPVSGIYRIDCSGNNKFYIGSAVSIYARWASHRYQLRNERHANKHIQNTWNKYGESSFQFSIIEQCDKEYLVAREQYWIDTLGAATSSFGMNNSPTASTSIGFKHSQETVILLSSLAKTRANAHLDQFKFKKGHPGTKGTTGQRWTDEMRQAASVSRKGRKTWNKGISVPNKVREKISKSVTGLNRTIPEEIREKIKTLRESGMIYKQISEVTGVSISYCAKISTNKTGRYVKNANK